jgi:hypothetical protein
LNAQAQTIHSMSAPVIARAEHISMEGDADAYVAPAKQPHRITRSSYTLASPIRGCLTELSIFEGCYLGVHMVRPERDPCKYQFDLRFANPKPVRVRHISWTWLIVSMGLALMGGASLASAWSAGISLLSTGVIGGGVAVLVSFLALVLFLRRTTESLEFRSMYGGVTLVSVTGGIGAARSGKQFFVELIKNINAAKLARPQAKQRLLRDEMREHHRLRELGALTEEQYEQSKARILAAH